MTFVDTNILVYARDSSNPEKQARAIAVLELLWRHGTGRLSTQVLQEYYVTVTRKLRPGLPPDMAREDIRDLLAWSPRPVTADVLESAWEIEDHWKLSWWDSLIVASALGCGVTTLLSEDLQDGLAVHSLKILNPFAQGFEVGQLGEM